MANMGFEINADEAALEYKGAFEVISPGIYPVVIVESRIEPTKSGTGKMLIFKYELQDGTKRHIVDRLNIINANETAQKIGRATLGKIAQVIGHKGMLSNTDILHGRPFNVKIVIEEFESNTEKNKMLKSNKVSDYFEKTGNAQAPVPKSAASGPAW